MPNITTNHAISYTNYKGEPEKRCRKLAHILQQWQWNSAEIIIFYGS